MRKPEKLEKLYIDFDSYFAHAEKQLRPELRGGPVGVSPMATKHTGLIAACYEAKKLGIKRGTSVEEARVICPEIKIVSARHDEYVKLHHKIKQVIDRFCPIHRVWSVDEMECHLIGRECEEAESLARRIKDGLRQEIGSYVTGSIGLAPNQHLAKIAAEMNKPDGLTVIRPSDLPEAIIDLPLSDVPGIGHRMEKRLFKAGIRTMRQFWEMSPKRARHLWGSVAGERVWAMLHGFDVDLPETERRVFGHGRVLSPDWRRYPEAEACSRLLICKAARRMRREQYSARRLALGVRFTNKARWFGEADISQGPYYGARDDHTITTSLSNLWRQVRRKHPKASASKISVSLYSLINEAGRLNDLFVETGEIKRVEMWEGLTDIMDGLNSRYNKAVVTLGPRREPPGGYAGAKIAFGRIPDLEEF